MTHVSTPFAPPEGYAWVFFTYVFAQIAFIAWLVHKYQLKKRYLLLFPLGIILAHLLSFILAAFFSPYESMIQFGHGPVPTVGRAGFVPFLIINLICLLFLLFFTNSMSSPLSIPVRKKVHAGILVIYIAFMFPFVPGKTMTSWWNGGYVIDDCRDNLSSLSTSLILFVSEEGRMPNASNMEELARVLNLDANKKDLFMCPFERRFFPGNEKYRWNRDLSGLTVEELKQVDPETLVIWCPTPHFFVGDPIGSPALRVGALLIFADPDNDPSVFTENFIESCISFQFKQNRIWNHEGIPSSRKHLETGSKAQEEMDPAVLDSE